jgi:membrane fusion protein (multidrug efflux system)
VVAATDITFRPSRTYVGTLEPWIEAKVGPQFVAAYVDTVLVRPGDAVKRGDVLATLDCRNASAASQAVAMQARALEQRQKAMADQSARITSMLDGGFVSKNEAEQSAAQSAAEEAQVLAERANLLGRTLEVNDCVLRAPFDGEIATRSIDPGAFVRPGTPLVSEVDRATVRLATDVPESDFEFVGPGKHVRVHILATGRDLDATVSRRAPAADPGTRTVACEVDIPDPSREVPVGTTGQLVVEVGDPIRATAVPLAATTVRNGKATLFVVENGLAHARTVPVLGESGEMLYVGPELAAGAEVVVEGRALLAEGDAVEVAR